MSMQISTAITITYLAASSLIRSVSNSSASALPSARNWSISFASLSRRARQPGRPSATTGGDVAKELLVKRTRSGLKVEELSEGLALVENPGRVVARVKDLSVAD